MHLTGPRQLIPGNNHAPSATAPGWTRRRFLSAAALLPLGLLAAGCGDDDSDEDEADATAPEPAKATFMAGFKPQANLPFVGAYVAQEKGFFREQNLDIEIRHAQQGEHLQLLLAGTVQFATANGAQVLQRNAEGLPLVSVALVGQKSEQGFIVGANSGINTVRDWAGKKFGYKGSPPVEFLAITKANGVDPDRIEQVRVGFDPRVLSEGQVDILAVFVSNEPGQLDRIGYKTKLFDPSDFNIPALGLTYITSAGYLTENPDVSGRFVKAALRGIEYADANRAEALDIVMKYAPQENRDQQQFMLETELARAASPLGFGAQTREQWQRLADALVEHGVLKKAPDVAKVFSAEVPAGFLRNGKVAWP
jgi:ABC-type nitrate/sulfonate/bicarbonate transport system substrate-binding protein